MGYIAHNAIVVTSWNSDSIEAAACFARNLGMTVLGPSAEAVNGYRSILVCPDGSKEGWQPSDEGDERRAGLREWMHSQAYSDGSSPLEWVEVRYGSDDRTAAVTNTAWELVAEMGDGDGTQ